MMLTPFLVSLAIACLALYFRSLTKEEIVRMFAVIVSLLSLVVGVILAPWFIQALLLIGVIFFWRVPVF
ncbi:MAG: hypothetical protein MUF49_19615 [Oculatellaceae cyanobacterium Prado106]|nr:hypothetical protein [Oculatellaceae cyanobacterium Prado106]